jgi:hypothetical protein
MRLLWKISLSSLRLEANQFPVSFHFSVGRYCLCLHEASIMVSCKRNMQDLDPINEKTRLLPPPPLKRLRYQGTGPSQYISFNFKMPIGRDVNMSSELERRSGSNLQLRGLWGSQNVEAPVSNNKFRLWYFVLFLFLRIKNKDKLFFILDNQNLNKICGLYFCFWTPRGDCLGCSPHPKSGPADTPDQQKSSRWNNQQILQKELVHFENPFLHVSFLGTIVMS